MIQFAEGRSLALAAQLAGFEGLVGFGMVGGNAAGDGLCGEGEVEGGAVA